MCVLTQMSGTLGALGFPRAHVNKHKRHGRERESDSRDTETGRSRVQVYSVPVCAQHGMGCLDTAPRIPHVLSPLLPPPMVSRLMVKVVPEPRARYQPEFEGYSPTRRARPQQTVTCYSRAGPQHLLAISTIHS